jgi:signal transduction histidine kinase
MLSQKSKIRLGYWVAIVLLVISYSLIFYNANQLNRQSKWISQSLLLMNKIDGIVRLTTEAETSFRGYVLTKNDTLLELYYRAQKNLPPVLAEVRSMLTDNPRQMERLDSLRRFVLRRMEMIQMGIRLYQNAGMTITPEMLSMREESASVMNNTRSTGDKMIEEENTVLTGRSSSFAVFFRHTMNITIISLLIALFAILYSLVNFVKENRARGVADEKAKDYEKELEGNIKKLEAINTEIKDLRSIEKFAATGRVARTIAHEVRNPLTNISLATEQLKEAETHNPESSLLLEMISRNTVRINQLVSDLLNATRFIQLDMKRTNIKDLLEETLTMAGDRINLGKIRVEKKYDTSPCFVMVDEAKIKIALLNIVINAIEAMDDNPGVLGILYRKEGKKCVVEISDSGMGMDEETIQSLFEPFFTRKPKGNGLGLTNTQNIMLNHKGNILVKSEIGKGTTVRLTLDLV